ncbi:type I-E CRISPR-associated protein Cas7/Cse4/CasC [Limnobaculum zhutongyuii]|uniref:Type I-E CRISPR-associated protein Cas7/Cse4/CasC n=1 Tax=Limnobaculum zhutongyuii TaxID=2498113 RepID=A0A411WKR3_9GAMM|nr:type I-E CRISPR-associated protein Cas7/Cse4/CasC [Limnobaculum zhutongyuii]QBH96772.1 type I-E CRISPR-associated protein Cas7/Cse4/CasC [Limnobaculum zhutongyuii]TQS90197.1 type I-E CRISPR-associated protein Cas7/Cse4/CasC [Limnobaculum zhutongyuii]
MTTFIQLHMLTAYAPANLNRDDTGRPKTAIMGGVERLRVSSQSLKRAWRTSEMFENALSGHIGVRTRQMGRKVYQQLIIGGFDEKLAMAISAKIAEQFGSLKKEKAPKDKLDNLDIEQLVHLSPEENQAVEQLIATLISENREPTDSELKLLRGQAHGVDIALFGRMLASSPEFNVEAACQVAHALGVSAVTIEEDFFTAVDDLNLRENDMGSAFMGERGFASALFYSYICISRDLLLENLGGDEALVKRTLKALTETVMKVSPTGNQNSFASRAYASYALAEIGSQQPRSLAAAFFNPIRGEDQIFKAVEQLQQQRQRFDDAYGACADKHYEMNLEIGNGTLPELLEFIAQ